MSIVDTIANQAGRLVGEMQGSIKRARLEGERRLLQRQHRAALEALGERAYELVRADRLDGSDLGPEIAEVEGKLMEIEAKITELDQLRDEDEDEAGADGSEPGEDARSDPSATAFPMVDERPGGPGAGPGWDAAGRFFAKEDDSPPSD